MANTPFYGTPGFADEISDALLVEWNNEIQRSFDRLAPELGSRFFVLDPGKLGESVTAAVQWFGDPAEPRFCSGQDVARQLSDWGVRGRHELHNEYCEYALVTRADADGRMRPKRVQVTTELREYWTTIAVHDPEVLRDLSSSVLGRSVAFRDLYGPGVDNPGPLSAERRLVLFSTEVAGHGNNQELADQGVPTQPRGRLNRDNALFMTHPINGLDDLLYIVMFGARPYAKRGTTPPEPATREQIFRHAGVDHLACRHADPAAAMAAAGAAFNGQAVAFANPLGMYIRSFAPGVFLVNGEVVPADWVRWSRGQDGTFQRLEFGPPDDDPHFLDDIVVAVGASEEPMRGGYELVQQIEVGPIALVGPETPVGPDEFVEVAVEGGPIVCSEARVCENISRLKTEFDNAQMPMRVAPRTMRAWTT